MESPVEISMIGQDYSTHVHTREATMKQSLFPEAGHLIQTADTQILAIYPSQKAHFSVSSLRLDK